jgi:DNA modification methylase
MRDVWEFPRVVGEERYEHATPKPVDMMARVLTSSSREGERIVEPFLGTGSTLIAAETTGRVCFGLEIEPRYVDICVKRWQTLTGRAAVLEGTGETFNARPNNGATGTETEADATSAT